MSLFVKDIITGTSFDLAAAVGVAHVGPQGVAEGMRHEFVVYFGGNGLRVVVQFVDGGTPGDLIDLWKRERSHRIDATDITAAVRAALKAERAERLASPETHAALREVADGLCARFPVSRERYMSVITGARAGRMTAGEINSRLFDVAATLREGGDACAAASFPEATARRNALGDRGPVPQQYRATPKS